MKKVFAILSVFALTIALVGLNSKSASNVSASELFTEDPTLSENEIPMYIMNSIYTTFPNFYDNASKNDENWGGSSRRYPWNETRLQVKQLDGNGNLTGKEYAIYFAGSTSADNAGAGNNIGGLFEEDGKVVFKRKDGSNWGKKEGFADTSLSHFMTNMSGKTLTFDATEVGLGATQGGNYYNRILVFDGEGRVVRGLGGDVLYQNPNSTTGSFINGEDGKVLFPAEYCYVNGVVTKAGEGVTCDKVKVEETQADGTTVEKEYDNYVYNRVLWQWFDSESYDASTVNTVAYLSEGWDANKWDYSWEQEGGYMCIAFVSGEGKNGNLTDAQLEVYTETCKAQGLPEPTAATYRSVARNIIVPEGGVLYDFGYLDKGINDMYVAFADMLISGYHYGQKLFDGKGVQRTATYNFSAKPVYENDAVYNNQNYRYMDGKNVIEVMKGNTIIPGKNAVYSGLAKYWATEGDIDSYQSDTSVLQLYVKVNGGTVVQPAKYNSFDDLVVDFIKDLNATLKQNNGKEGGGYVEVPMPDTTLANPGTGSAWYSQVNNYIFTGSTYQKISFLKTTVDGVDMGEKWTWLFEYMAFKVPALGINVETGGCASPGNFTYSLWGFLAQKPEITGWPASKADWTNAADCLKSAKWEDYVIECADAPVNTKYSVEYTAINTVNNNKSTLVIDYVIVDEFTPRMKVNKGALIITPKLEDGKVIIPSVDPDTFVTTSDGSVNDLSLNHKVTFTWDGLPFSAETVITEGNHTVVATVYNDKKFISKAFTVSIEDMTAPFVSTHDVTIPFGGTFDATMGIDYAYDAVDGNLLSGSVRNWCVGETSPEIDTTKPGKYEVTVTVSDLAGNSTEASYTVYVSKALSDDETKKVDTINNALTSVTKELSSVKETVEELADKVQEIEDLVKANSKKCGSKSAIIVEFLAATSLLVVFLRKKH